MKKKLLLTVVTIVLLVGLTGCGLQETINGMMEERMLKEAFGVGSVEELIIMEMMERDDVAFCDVQSTINGSYIIDLFMTDGSEVQMIMGNDGEISTYVFE